jgi:hypothetical protein
VPGSKSPVSPAEWRGPGVLSIERIPFIAMEQESHPTCVKGS